MKNSIVLIVCFVLFSLHLMGQDKESLPLKEGKLYHVAIENKLMPTTSIKKTLQKYPGKIKLILYSKKAKKKTYKIPKKITNLINKGEPISMKNMNRICECTYKSGSYWEIKYYVSCRPYHGCESCCESVLPVEYAYDWFDNLY